MDPTQNELIETLHTYRKYLESLREISEGLAKLTLGEVKKGAAKKARTEILALTKNMKASYEDDANRTFSFLRSHYLLEPRYQQPVLLRPDVGLRALPAIFKLMENAVNRGLPPSAYARQKCWKDNLQIVITTLERMEEVAFICCYFSENLDKALQTIAECREFVDIHFTDPDFARRREKLLRTVIAPKMQLIWYEEAYYFNGAKLFLEPDEERLLTSVYDLKGKPLIRLTEATSAERMLLSSLRTKLAIAGAPADVLSYRRKTKSSAGRLSLNPSYIAHRKPLNP